MKGSGARTRSVRGRADLWRAADSPVNLQPPNAQAPNAQARPSGLSALGQAAERLVVSRLCSPFERQSAAFGRHGFAQYLFPGGLSRGRGPLGCGPVGDPVLVVAAQP